ncbi:hypothetical protein SAMN04487854_102261 [Pseudoalteromonas lipolytica]|uniref:Uncharacterized protein n=2 Tax=Pseudoalteromonas TaxID=53246 RepID=A0ABY1G9F6_9GAMM|nr:hypothetical protein [Pseudoalteromonas lipolytica LMEB 39]SFT41714.1 hypothetical protein SAMN04487854_102261 [Pseudoalteromonas lipolytica]
MNVDNNIHETEVEYLQILINSFSLDNSVLDDVVDFAKAPDKATIQAFVTYYQRKPLAQLFLFDALMMTRRDNQVHEKEMPLVNAMATQLEILKGTQQDIFDLFCHIKNRNWQESALYFSSHLLTPDYFKHLLAYHEVEYKALMAETAEIRRNRLIEVIKKKVNLDDLEWEELNYTKGNYKIKYEITTNFIPNLLTHELLLPFLQIKLERHELRISNNDIYIVKNAEELLYANLSDLLLVYDSERNTLSVKAEYISGDNIVVSSELSKDFFDLILHPLHSNNSNESKSYDELNVILGSIFSAEIAQAEDYALKQSYLSGINGARLWAASLKNIQTEEKIFFPYSSNYFLQNEIVLGLDDQLYINTGCVGEVLMSDINYLCDLSPWEVLVSGQFRLMRPIKGSKK